MIPLYSINPQGQLQPLAQLVTTKQGYQIVEATENWLLGEQKGWFSDLPYFLQDLYLQGFLGRLIAYQLSQENPFFTSNPRQWSTKTLLYYLQQYGIDLPGHILIGEKLFQSFQNYQPLLTQDRETSYPQYVQKVLQWGIPDSSAGGEQPKFTTMLYEENHYQAVIVKFSPLATHAAAIRWRDLLVAEHIAQQLLAEQGLGVKTQLFNIQGRLFLESPRFDRCGYQGRFPSLSLSIVDAEFTGLGESWSQVAKALFQQQYISEKTLEKIYFVEQFGTAIGNTDRHLGNLSLWPDKDTWQLHLIYDTLPMGWQPLQENCPHFPWQLPKNTPLPVQTLAFYFWKQLSQHPWLSCDFQNIAEKNLQQFK